MKKLIIVTIIILINVFTSNINALNIYNNNLKFMGYTPTIKSTILEDAEGATLIINDKYNVYELFIPELSDYSVECTSKKELLEYYKAYKENKHKQGIIKIKKNNNNNTYDVYFPFLGGNPYKIDKQYLKGLILTYRENKEV